MTTQHVLWIIFGLGIFGHGLFLKPLLRDSARETITARDPIGRWLCRIGMFGICYFWSWVFSGILISRLAPDVLNELKHMPQSKALLIDLSLPLPLALLGVVLWTMMLLSRDLEP